MPRNTLTLLKGKNCICPHCKYEFDEPVDDFVIPGLEGAASKCDMDCDECDKVFSVVKNDDGTFTISA